MCEIETHNPGCPGIGNAGHIKLWMMEQPFTQLMKRPLEHCGDHASSVLSCGCMFNIGEVARRYAQQRSMRVATPEEIKIQAEIEWDRWVKYLEQLKQAKEKSKQA